MQENSPQTSEVLPSFSTQPCRHAGNELEQPGRRLARSSRSAVSPAKPGGVSSLQSNLAGFPYASQVQHGLKMVTEDMAACCRLQVPEALRTGSIQRAPKNQWMDKGDLTLPCFNSIWDFFFLNLNSIFKKKKA